jgi:superfamily II DNA or RNA helicase
MPPPFILHGRMSKKQRNQAVSALEALPPDVPRVILATGKLVDEGFDHPPLDALVLAMPVSWKGTLQQYAGRLHRQHAAKTSVLIVDYVDTVRADDWADACARAERARRLRHKRRPGSKRRVCRRGTSASLVIARPPSSTLFRVSG